MGQRWQVCFLKQNVFHELIVVQQDKKGKKRSHVYFLKQILKKVSFFQYISILMIALQIVALPNHNPRWGDYRTLDSERQIS